MQLPRLPLLAAIASITLAGCVTTGVGTIASHDGQEGRPIVFNAMTLTPVSAPRPVALPFSGTLEDIAAMSSALKRLDARRTAALMAGEFEMAAVWNHYHAKLAAVRMGMNVATGDAVSQLQGNAGRAFQLAPGAVVVLRSGLDEAKQQLAWLNAFDANPWAGLKVEVADASETGGFVEALRIINRTLEQANEAIKPGSTTRTDDGAGSGIYSGQAATILGVEAVPANVPFALSNGAVLVRRVTPKGSTFVFYNPSRGAVDVPLEDLAYVPPPPPFSRHRQAAAPIFATMAQATWSQYVNVYRDSGLGQPPAHDFPASMYAGGPYFGRDGRLTTDQREIAAVERLLEQRDNAFTYAAGISQRVHGYANNVACGHVNDAYHERVMNGRQPDSDWRPYVYIVARVQYSGPYAANANITCRDSRDAKLRTVYSQNYFVGERGEPVRTAVSLLTDQRVAERLRRIDLRNEAAGDVLSVVPVVGNAVSGFRCVEPNQAKRAQLMAKLTDPGFAQSRPFVEYLYDVSTVERGDLFGDTATHYLDCAAAVPLVGNAVKSGMLATKGLNAAWKVGGSARFAKMSAALDSAATVADGMSKLEQMAGTPGKVAGKAAKVALRVQREAQHADNLVDFSSGLEAAADLSQPEAPRSQS